VFLKPETEREEKRFCLLANETREILKTLALWVIRIFFAQKTTAWSQICSGLV
jgi:hypothetical protein